MGTLGQALYSTSARIAATRTLSFVLALPLLAVLAAEAYPYLKSMSAAKAVVVFSVVGGAAGVASQTIAAEQLDKLGRPVNFLELVPAVLASILALSLVTYALLPPSPNPATVFLRSSGMLPS